MESRAILQFPPRELELVHKKDFRRLCYASCVLYSLRILGFCLGGLSLAVEGPSKAEISCHDNKDGTVSVSYLPTAPGEYKISVKFGDKNIKGSPFTAKITGKKGLSKTYKTTRTVGSFKVAYCMRL